MNAATGHVEAVFAKADRANYLELVTREAVVQEIAYLLANPAKAGLVDTAHEWPGGITRAEDLASGPEYMGSVGDSPYLAAREAEGIANSVSTQLAQHERDARNERRRKGLTVLGADAVRKQHWRKMPKTGARLFGLIVYHCRC